MQVIEPNSLSAVLGVLTALIAPALLISASGTLINSTAQRLISNTDRFRHLALSLRRLEGQAGASSMAKRRQLDVQLEWTYRRVLLQQRALTLFYTAAVFFVACSFALGLEAMTTALPPLLPVVLGLLGVLILLVAVALLLVETYRLVAGMREELATLHAEVRRAGRTAPADVPA
jgi:hypothetical protein